MSEHQLNDKKSDSIFTPVMETTKIKKNIDSLGNKMVNQYILLKELGRGVHGKVKLCKDSNDEDWAVKILEKNPKRRFQSKLTQAYKANELSPQNTQLDKIKREIAILKKCSHPHVVRLREVIDDPSSDKIYLVLEYLPGGEVQWQSNDEDDPKPVHTESQVRLIFRDLVAGVQYLHYQGIVHRDIKPANLLWTADKRIKISDFGVSVFVGKIKKEKSKKSADKVELSVANESELSKTAGSPAFFAPELCNIIDDDPPSPESNPFPQGRGNETFYQIYGDDRKSPTLNGTPKSRKDSFESTLGGQTIETNESSPVKESIDNQLGQTNVSNSLETSPTNFQSTHVLSTNLSDAEHKHDLQVDTQLPHFKLEPRTSSLVHQPKLSKSLRLLLPPSRYTPPMGAPIDIWAMGVTLYCLYFGRVPFTAQSEFELFHIINKKPLEFPESVPISKNLRGLLLRMLEKDPTKRITMEEIKYHIWTTEDLTGEARLTWLDENDPGHELSQTVKVSEEEIKGAVTLKDRLKDGMRKISNSFHNLATTFKRSPSQPLVGSSPTKAPRSSAKSVPAIMGYLPLSLEKKATQLADHPVPKSPKSPRSPKSTGTPVEGEMAAAEWVRWEVNDTWADNLNNSLQPKPE